MKLYYSPGACSLAPHIVLMELGLDFETEAVDLKSKRTASGSDFTAINRKGYVPALRLDGGELLTEGVAILQYLADHYAFGRMAPPCGSLERARLQALMHFTGAELHKAFVPFFIPDSSPQAKQAAAFSVAAKLDIIESNFADGRLFLSGADYTIADVYLFVVARFANASGLDMGRWPMLAGFVERVSARPAVRAAMADEGEMVAST